MSKKHAPRKIVKEKLWAYFAPDGYIQVWTIAATKKDSKTTIKRYDPLHTHEDYIKAGYVLNKIELSVTPL